MKGFILIPDGKVTPEAKEKLNKLILKRDKRLKEMRRKYLNGEYDKFFNMLP